jgi:hypothetical protein
VVSWKFGVSGLGFEVVNHTRNTRHTSWEFCERGVSDELEVRGSLPMNGQW